jgi:hypothetical protein
MARLGAEVSASKRAGEWIVAAEHRTPGKRPQEQMRSEGRLEVELVAQVLAQQAPFSETKFQPRDALRLLPPFSVLLLPILSLP